VITRHGLREELIRSLDGNLRARARKTLEMIEQVIREREARVFGEDHEPEPLDEPALFTAVKYAILGKP